MNVGQRWLLLLLVFSFIPHVTCQETNHGLIQTNLSVSDIEFNEGKLTLYGLYIRIDRNESFGVLVYSPVMYEPDLWEERSRYENGQYSLTEIFYENGLAVKFDLHKVIFLNDVLEFNLVIGLNITTQASTRKVSSNLNLPLRDEWKINGILLEVPKDEASQYLPMGVWALNNSIQKHNIQEFYILKVQIIRLLNIRNAFLWLPPIFMLALLLVSLLLVYKKDLANVLRVYLTVAFFSFGYLLLLREITPPIMTSIETFTLSDALFCIVITIIAIPWSLRTD